MTEKKRSGPINNVTRQFNKILAIAHTDKRTFHDIRRTAITNWWFWQMI
ncbi:MAG: hypothetical protein ACYS1A_09840 [Planctomycetota bacterium]